MSPRFKGLWRPSLFKLMLMILLLLACEIEAARGTGGSPENGEPAGSRAGSRLQSASSPSISDAETDDDPMEPCYLSNNRASESLTISESTPVGTVVGELMVNGDSSANGNIELSIKMPGGQTGGSGSGFRTGGAVESNRHAIGGQRQARQTNANAFSTASSTKGGANSPSSTTSNGKGSQVTAEGGQIAAPEKWPPSGTGGSHYFSTTLNQMAGAKSARDLNSLIDLMPPLTIEHDTKRLILAKKLDRENLDRYIMAGGYQSSPISSQSQSSSASLTVHIKCQLRLDPATRTRPTTSRPGTLLTTTTPPSGAGNLETTRASGFGANMTLGVGTQMNDNQSINSSKNSRISSSSSSSSSSRKQHANSIIIPIHLIVTDENDNWPVFINAPYIVDLNETALIGAPLSGNEIVAMDNDQQGPLSTIEYSIVGGSFWSDSFAFLNPLDSRSLIVKDNRLLDYESQSKLTLKVMARDQGEPPNWAIGSLHINLFDQDDLNPVFGEDKYLGYVRDNRPGEVVDLIPKRLSARDGDRTINAPISYSFHIKTNHSIHFELDPDLGRLLLKKTLPEEPDNAPFCLLIRATQVDNPQRWSLTMVQIRLAREMMSHLMSQSSIGPLEQLLPAASGGHPEAGNNRDQPSQPQQQVMMMMNQFRFAQPNFTVRVSEAAPMGYTILNLRAAYNHNQKGAQNSESSVTYHLLDNELEYFNLDQLSGRLSLNKSLDYELYRQLSIRVLATSEEVEEHGKKSPAASGRVGNLPRLACDLVRVNIQILANNDFTPEFSHEQYNFQLSVSDLIANFDLPNLQAAAAAAVSGAGSENVFDDETKIQRENQDDAITTSNELRRRLTKRFGELDERDSEFNFDEPLPWPAMKLGQVYCSDRDYGDRVSLKLIGSKANLFYLSQDGRLYLPLVNTSSPTSSSSSQQINARQPQFATPAGQENSAGNSQHGDSGLQAGPSWSRPGEQSRGIINNQFAQSSRFFALRRNDNQAAQAAQVEPPPDRGYLNHLLGEFSNLGRLRLKVLATDDGQPQQRQATALIVIAVISIDNFILQRAPNLPPSPSQAAANHQQQMLAAMGGGDAGAIQLTNDTSYDTSRPELDSNSSRSSQYYQSQVMMIPATNGRSFVQINPDIMSSLISQNSFHNNASPFNATAAGSLNSSTSDESKRAGGHFSPPLLPKNGSGGGGGGGGNGNGNGNGNGKFSAGGSNPELQPFEAESQIQTSQTSARFQPPSLLLVDDDGAKFVAMPAAIEVYQQQVQEAAAELQRQRSQTSSTGSPDGISIRRAHENSLFHQLKSHFGFSSHKKDSKQQAPPSGAGGSLYWLNLSTAIVLHLIALLVVVTLVSKIRCSHLGMGDGGGGLWSARISRPPWRQPHREHSVASILEQASGTYGLSHQKRDCASSSDGSEGGSAFGFLHSANPQSGLRDLQQAPSNAQHQTAGHCPFIGGTGKQQLGGQTSSLAGNSDSAVRFPLRGRQQQQQSQQQASSSGAAVGGGSASNGYKPRTADHHMEAKQQNLFGHLKLTLNKMLDSRSPIEDGHHGKKDGCMIGQVSIRSLDSDSIEFESIGRGGADEQATMVEQVILADRELEMLASSANEPTAAPGAGPMESNRPAANETTSATATRSSTFVGQPVASSGTNQQQQQQGTVRSSQAPGSGHRQVVSISVSGPKLDPCGQAQVELGSHPSGQRSTTGSSSSSVVSLISMSSSISNKINAAVQRTGEYTATGSDVSSLDSTTLFNNTATAAINTDGGLRSGRQMKTHFDVATVKAAPPPPPPPPPPCMVQVGGRLVIESLKQASSANKQQSMMRESEAGAAISVDDSAVLGLSGTGTDSLKLRASKPFSARPLDAEVDSALRRPLPQNPLHVKLRQQASSGSMQDQGSKRKHNNNNNHHHHHQQQQQQQQQQLLLLQGAVCTNNRKQCSRATSENRIISSTKASLNMKARPPTPPPLPGQAPVPHTKTVSPTTSVDRGYESFQSYTSSSQQQQQLVNTGRTAASTRGTARADLVASSSNGAPSGNLQGRLTLEFMETSSHRQPSMGQENGGSAPSVNGKQVNDHGYDTAARVRRASQTLASGNRSSSGHCQATMSTVHRLGSRRYHHPGSRLISATDDILPATTNAGTRLKQAGGLAAGSAAPVASGAGGRSGSLGQKYGRHLNLSHDRLHFHDSEEDEDFYYCYNQLGTGGCNMGGNSASVAAIPGANQCASSNSVLIDYASHAYLKAGANNGGSDSSSETYSTSHHNRQPANYHSRHHNHQNHHHHHHHHHKPTNGQQQQHLSNSSHRHLYSANAAAAAAASKKQLTWSDQVGVG